MSSGPQLLIMPERGDLRAVTLRHICTHASMHIHVMYLINMSYLTYDIYAYNTHT